MFLFFFYNLYAGVLPFNPRVILVVLNNGSHSVDFGH